MKKFRFDIQKYKQYSGGKSTIILLLTTQGLWALFGYRIANSIYSSKMPKWLKKILLIGAIIHQKAIEMITGICLPYSASIGTHFYIAHFGHIIIHPKTVIGNNCNIAQGVTIGVSGRGTKRGVPVIGNNVFIAANAVIAGNIEVGDNCVIGANSLLINSITENTTVLGVPAVKISDNSSKGYI